MSRLEDIVTIVELHRLLYGGAAVAEWVRALDWRPGGPGFEFRGGNFRNFGKSVYPGLPVYFGGDTKIRRSLLSGVYARGVKYPTSLHWKWVTCL